ncbi:Nitric oxide reductase large subunit [Moraxella caprae]|uniref:Nitric oxide reductase large subunit n=1 Tax=Moraxella caprae TaxID=90240 RepID=A0A378R136_9GAMM|nr:Nitric oxide reductase large subunit [Moraxella caprae]
MAFLWRTGCLTHWCGHGTFRRHCFGLPRHFWRQAYFLTPIINGGKDSKFQKLGVDILWVALIIVCVGSFIAQFFALKHIMPAHLNFWFRHQGYEFIDLGRFCRF